MKLNERTEQDATPEQVYAVMADPAYQEAKCAATSTGNYTANVDAGADRMTIHTERLLPSDRLPDLVRSFVGQNLVIIEKQTWGPPEGDGTRRGSLDIHIKGVPLTAKGTVSLVSIDGNRTQQEVLALVTANIPLIGGRIEAGAADPIRYVIATEFRLIREHLAG